MGGWGVERRFVMVILVTYINLESTFCRCCKSRTQISCKRYHDVKLSEKGNKPKAR